MQRCSRTVAAFSCGKFAPAILRSAKRASHLRETDRAGSAVVAMTFAKYTRQDAGSDAEKIRNPNYVQAIVQPCCDR